LALSLNRSTAILADIVLRETGSHGISFQFAAPRLLSPRLVAEKTGEGELIEGAIWTEPGEDAEILFESAVTH
jgi:hypothetical protein